MDPLLLAYLTFTFILVATPGSTTAVVVRNTLDGQREAGFAAAAGAALGNTTHAAAAGLGLAIVFARWPFALSALRIGGALFLTWLGVVSLSRAVRRESGEMRFLAQSGPGGAESQKGSFREGLTVNLLNPSIATFYLVVVPTFLPARSPRWYFALLAAAHIVMAFACHSLWVLALNRLRRFFSHPAARRILEAATGVALLALAARILIS